MSNLDDIRSELVMAALPHVPFDGWSSRAMRHAARDCGLDQAAADRAAIPRAPEPTGATVPERR